MGYNSIPDNELERQYDAQCKKVLSYKPILAKILKEVVREVKDMTISEIISCIEGDVAFSKVPLLESPNKITGTNTESTSVNEGTIYYDIRFYVIIINEKSKYCLM